jgi:hypothetical protein
MRPAWHRRYETYDAATVWRHYGELPLEVQKLADKNYRLLKSDPSHPSLHFKKVGGKNTCGQ